MTFNVCKLTKTHLGGWGNPRTECRMWQNNLNVLPMYETTYLRKWNKKQVGKWLASMKWKAKETTYKHYTVVENIVSHRGFS